MQLSFFFLIKFKTMCVCVERSGHFYFILRFFFASSKPVSWLFHLEPDERKKEEEEEEGALSLFFFFLYSPWLLLTSTHKHLWGLIVRLLP